MVWICDENSKAVVDPLRKMAKWQSPHARIMKQDPENPTSWEHEWGWHNRGNVWDKMATCWAGKEDWIVARKQKIHKRRSTSSSRSF